MNRRSLHGFTLIELLVVISIIAVLMAIMVPVLGRSKDRANRILCNSNMQQIYRAGYLYAHDYNEYLPLGNVWGKENTPEGWTDMNFHTALVLYQSYSLTEQIGMCPTWKQWREEFFKVPPSYDGEKFKLGGTVVGYIYYGRRFDEPGSNYSPLLEDGRLYKTPTKAVDGGKNITSDTILSCFHWDTISTGGSWGAKMPHIKNGIGVIYQPGATEMTPKPEGLNIAKLDGSSGWVKWRKLDSVTQGKVRFYYSR